MGQQRKIGITSDLERRKKELAQDYKDPRIKILDKNLTRKQAQARERAEAGKPGRESHPGGRPPKNPRARFTVYEMDHKGRR